jgi:hypothetical protein
MIGHYREKQVDGVCSGVALSLRQLENSDPPGRQLSRLLMRSTTPPRDFVKDLANAAAAACAVLSC